MTIATPVTQAQAPIRTRYLRTNLSYDPTSLQYAPPHFTVYDPTHKRFFVSNPYLNEIDVFDAANEIQTATISVPFPWGIDISPYNGSLYAGTFVGDVYQIDLGSLSVTNRYLSSAIGPNGYAATTALVLSDGRLALHGGAGGVDGFGGIVVWDPATNALDSGPSSNGSICSNANNGAFAVSGDRTRILSTWVDTSNSEPVCSYDPVARIETYGAFPYDTPVRQIIPSPDGTRFYLTSNLEGVGVFDAKTVQLLGQITGPNSYSGIPNAAAGAVLSLDGKTLYLVEQLTGQVGTFDTTSLTQTAWVPSLTVNDMESTVVISAIDETGLIVGPTGHGVGFVDGSQLMPSNLPLINVGFFQPASGPLMGNTTISSAAYYENTPSLPTAVSQIYLGNVPGTNAAFVPTTPNQPSLQVTTPPSLQTGAVDITVLFGDNGVAIAPEAFSYGPTILEVVSNGATADGGQLGAVIGYGFGQSASSVQVSIGGKPAPVTTVYPSAPTSPYPFPTEALQFTVPAGTAGTAVDFTVTTPSGSATAQSAFHYTSAVASYPLAANLQSGIYDSHRDVYYFADQKQIQVLSKTSGKWLAPIPLSGATSLLAISESPDGSKLAVSDYGGNAIFVVDPDTPQSPNRYPVSFPPVGLAVTNVGSVYFSSYSGQAFNELDTSTGLVQVFRVAGGVGGGQYDRVLLSPDGSRIYSSIAGISFWLNTSNNQINYSPTTSGPSGGIHEVAVSGDGSTVWIDDYLTDSSLEAETVPEYVDWETWFASTTVGQKLSQDGTILFQPLADGIDTISRNSGRLLYRIQIPVTTANVYDPLVVASGTNTVAVVTATGVSFVDLSTLSVPANISQPFPEARPVASTKVLSIQGKASVGPSAPNRTAVMNARPRLKLTLPPK
jgi:streptogramin lyase